MGLKSGIPFRFMSRLVKILKLSKTLLKIGMVVHVTVGCVRVELNLFCIIIQKIAAVNWDDFRKVIDIGVVKLSV